MSEVIPLIPPDLRDELEYARSLDVGKLSSRIVKIGFGCNNCGACCTRQDEVDEDGWADNAVVVYPFEIRRIMEVTGLSWHEVVKPPASGEVDDKGRVHTFEWHLRQKYIDGHGVAKGQEVHACRFLKHERCTIYEYRPFLCRTYPFYMSDRKLYVGPCDRLCVAISRKECLKLASAIKERYVEDLNQMILLLEKFEPYTPKSGIGSGNYSSYDIYDNSNNNTYDTDNNTYDTDSSCGCALVKSSGKIIEYVVHDSEGAHQISIQQE